MTTREERLAHNQSIFRAANEGIERTARGRSDLLAFLCECSDPSCTETIRLSHDEYEHVRSDPAYFAVLPGHEGAAETVRTERERFAVVEKIGGAREAALDRDPRA